MKKRQSILLLILCFAILLAVIICVCFFSGYTPMNPEGTVGNTAGNLNNRGLFCEYDGVVYFSNPYDNGALYSMMPDESQMKKLGSAPIELINAGGHYLYYFQTAASGSSGLGYMRTRNGIYRSNLNGKKTVCFSKDTAFSIQLVENDLYYLVSDAKGPHFYKQKIDRSGEILLSDTQINPACVAGNLIYYNGTEKDHALYAFDPATNTSDMVWAGNLWNPVVEGDYVYYMDVANNYRLCRYSFSGNIIEVLTEDRIDTYNLCGGWIYYQKSSGAEPCLKRMRQDGSNQEIVAEGIFSDINATSRYVYFHPFGNTVPTYRTPVDGMIQVETFDAAMQAAMNP